MLESKRNLIGSSSHDEFKRNHKDLSPRLYCADLDLVTVEKYPFPDIGMALDFKQPYDLVTFSEVIVYNALVLRGIDVYIVRGDQAEGRFEIQRYVAGHHTQPEYTTELVISTTNWKEFEEWEIGIRQARRKRWTFNNGASNGHPV